MKLLFAVSALAAALAASAALTRDAGEAEPPCVPTAAPLVPAGAWAGVLHEHPRLLGPRSQLRARAKAKPELYRELAAQDSLAAVGLADAVEGVAPERAQPFIAAVMQHVRQGVTNEHQLTSYALNDAAMTFDLFHDRISPQDRQAMVEWMNAHLTTYLEDENAFHNSTLAKVMCYLRVAYATWGENPRAPEFRDYAIHKLYEGKLLPVIREFGAGGGHPECGWYAHGAIWLLVEGLELARRIEGYDGFARAPQFYYQRLAYDLHSAYPGSWPNGAERYPMEGDGSPVYSANCVYPRDLRLFLSQYFAGSELARYAAGRLPPGVTAKARGTDHLSPKLVDFLYRLAPARPRDLRTFPTAHLSSGIGQVYARSDWSEEASWLRFECGDYWNGHQHFEVGNFEIFRYEPLATESGEYDSYLSNHSVNWYARTIAHNCLLVYQPAERSWVRMRDGGANRYANDGGQAKKWDWTPDSREDWERAREQYARGRIVAYQNRPAYLYVASDCTQAYAPSKLEKWIRQIVFLRPHTFVIFDRVVSRKPEYEKTWLLHCHQEPEIQGETVTITNGKGSLVVRTLLPESPRIAKVEGYAYRGETFPPDYAQYPRAVNRWRIEVSPSAARKEDLFLHVLSTDGLKPAELVRRGETVGVRVEGAEMLFSGDVGGSVTLAGRRSVLRARVIKGRYE